MTLGRAGLRTHRSPASPRGPGRPRRIVLVVGDPDVVVAIDVNAVGRHEEPGAKALDQPAGRVEVKNGIDRRRFEAGAVAAAPVGDPDTRAVPVHVHGAQRSPRAAARQLGHPRRCDRDSAPSWCRAAPVACPVAADAPSSRRGVRPAALEPAAVARESLACRRRVYSPGTRTWRSSLPSADPRRLVLERHRAGREHAPAQRDRRKPRHATDPGPRAAWPRRARLVGCPCGQRQRSTGRRFQVRDACAAGRSARVRSAAA